MLGRLKCRNSGGGHVGLLVSNLSSLSRSFEFDKTELRHRNERVERLTPTIDGGTVTREFRRNAPNYTVPYISTRYACPNLDDIMPMKVLTKL